MVTGNGWQSVEKWTSLWVEPSNCSPSALWRTPWINPWFVRRHSLNLKRCPQLKRQVSSSVIKCPHIFVDLPCFWLLKHQHHNMSYLEAYFSWQLCFEGTLSHFEMFPYSDRPRNNMCLRRTECRLDTSNIPAYWTNTMADVVKCLRHILLAQF